MKSCKNCGTEHDGNYCPNCGQKHLERFETRSILSEALTSVVNMDRGFFATTWKLIIRPGEVIADYIEQKTIPYFNPFRMLVIWITLISFLMFKTSSFKDAERGFLEGASGGTANDPEGLNSLLSSGWGEQFTNVFSFLMIPITALFFGWIFRKSKQVNYAESLIFSTYATVPALVVCMPFIFLDYWFENDFPTSFFAAMILGPFYLGLSIKQLFKMSMTKGMLWGLALFSVTYVGGFIAIFLVVMIFVVIFIFIKKKMLG